MVSLKVVHLNASSSGGAFQVAQRLHVALNSIPGVQSSHLVYTGEESTEYTLWANSWWKRKMAFFLHALEKLDFLRYEKDGALRFAFSHAKTGISVLNHPLVKNADVVHLHWINKGFIRLGELEKLLKSEKKIVWTAHDMWPFTGGCYYSGACDHFKDECRNCKYLRTESMLLSAKLLKAKRSLYGTSQLQFITPSDWLKSIGLASLESTTIERVYNGIDTSLFKPEKGLRSKYGFNDSDFIVSFAAASLSDKRKGASDFVEMITLLHTEVNNLHVLFIGNRKEGLNIPEEINVTYSGFIDKEYIMKDYYNISDVYVTTSHDDNLPTTIMESLSCGTPVFGYGVGGIVEMVSDSRGGLVEDKDIHGLAEKLKHFANGSEEIKVQLSENARLFATDNFDIKDIAQKHLSIYNS